jgi:hypothetical protein
MFGPPTFSPTTTFFISNFTMVKRKLGALEKVEADLYVYLV